MRECPRIICRKKLSIWIKALGERVVDIRVMNEAKAEEDIREVKDKSFDTIVECEDTTRGSVRT